MIDFVERKLHYHVQFKDCAEWNEGDLILKYSMREDVPECYFITVAYEDIKFRIAEKHNKSTFDIEKFEINKVEVINQLTKFKGSEKVFNKQEAINELNGGNE